MCGPTFMFVLFLSVLQLLFVVASLVPDERR
jgi:hypothetical protein